MTSLRIGCSTKPSILISLPSTAQRCSPASASGFSFLRYKGWKNAEMQPAKPVISQQHRLNRYRKSCQIRSLAEEAKFETPIKSHLEAFKGNLDAFNRFTQPRIYVTHILSIVSASLLAVEKYADISPSFLAVLCQVIVAGFFMHIYVASLNQLTDIDIDKVNKPYRPLITGEYSINTAVIIISSSLIMSFLIGWMVGSVPLICSLFTWFAIGTIYSINVPFLRWKANPLAATFCIAALQVSWSLGNYLHVQTYVLGQPVVFSKAIIIGSTFTAIIACAISQFKDITDIEGDKLNGIQTLAVQFGPEKVFWSCTGLVLFANLIVILAGLTSPNNWTKFIIVVSHMFLASRIWIRAKSVDLKYKGAILAFYGTLWTVVSVEYFLIHLLK